MYDIAVSFAGEDRNLVEKITTIIKNNGHTVFYDKYEEISLWGKDLTKELPAKYRNSKFVLIFISESYLEKMWTNFERQIIIQKHLKLNGKQFLLPIRIDDFNGELPGLSELIGYLSVHTDSEKSINRLCYNISTLLESS